MLRIYIYKKREISFSFFLKIKKMIFPPLREGSSSSFQKDVHRFFLPSYVEKIKGDDKVKLFPYQTLFADLFQTYSKFLLISEPGTGKSATFIEACEVALQNNTAKHVFIFETSKVLINNILSEIYKWTVEPFELAGDKKVKNIKYIKNFLRDKYTVTTYTKFYNKHSSFTDEELRKKFGSCIFVFDEVHKFIGSTTVTINSYQKELEFFYKLFSPPIITPENHRIILASATPLTTDVSQLEPYVRLLGLSELFKKRTSYTSQYIKNLFLGYTSFVKMKNDSGVIKKFISRKPVEYNFLISNKTTDFIETDLYYSKLHSIQLETYKYYDSSPDKRGSYKSNIIQAAAFVFPDGSIGGMIEGSGGRGGGGGDNNFFLGEIITEKKPDEEDEIFMYEDSLSVKEKNKEGGKGLKKYAEDVSKDYKINGIYQLKNTFKKSDFQDLSELSAKMNSIIEIEKENETTPGTVFIYTGNMKNGGGAIMLSLMLEKYAGFTNFLKTGIFSRKTYVLLNTEMSDNEKKRINDIFNSKENRKGEKIRIIIGTSQLKEGISFFNCVRVHLLNRAWTYSEDYQSISRALRTGGHAALKEYYKDAGQPNKQIVVNIYKHAVYYVDKKENKFFSVDLEIEKLNLDRQPPLDEIFEGFVEAAVDKLFFIEENQKKSSSPLPTKKIEEQHNDDDDDERRRRVKEQQEYIYTDSFYNTLSKVDFKLSKNNVLQKNNCIEKNYKDSYKEYIIKQSSNIINTYLYKNSIKIFGNFQQNFINRNRLYRFLNNRSKDHDRFNSLFFDFVYNSAMYKKNIFKIVNNFLITEDNKKNNDNSISFSLSFNDQLKDVNISKLIETFYRKINKNIFGLYDKETKELKIVDKTHKQNNKGKNLFSYSKEEMYFFYKNLINKKETAYFTKEFYYSEFYNYFKKNGLLLVV